MSLEFYKQIFENCLNNDGLVVLGNGLGIHHIILGFLKYYSDSSELVLFLDCGSNESLQNSYLFYCERLINFGIKYSNLPSMINQESSGSSKLNMYSKGGVYFGAASIFVLDFLTKRMPCNLVSGLIIQNAHRISDTSIEYLLIKLFKKSNKNGFIKSFTTEPHYLVDEIGKLSRTMKYLHQSKLFLWPRYHQQIACILDKHPPDLVELSIDMTLSMKQIEYELYKNIQKCTHMLIQLNKLPKIDGGTIGSGGSGSDAFNNSGNFETILNQQLKPIWSKLSGYSKQLVSGIKLLNQLSNNLLSYDCVTFYHILLLIQTSSDSLKENGVSSTHYVDQVQTWLETKEAESLFQVSQQRVYTLKNKLVNKSNLKSPPKKQRLSIEEDGDDKSKTTTTTTTSTTTTTTTTTSTTREEKKFEKILKLEQNPKWNVLYEVLKEIEKDNTISQGAVLVFVKDEKTVQQLHSFLDLGGYTFLLNRYEKFEENQRIQEEIRNQTILNQIAEQQKQQQQQGIPQPIKPTFSSSYNYYGKKNSRTNIKQQITEKMKKKKTNGGGSKDSTLFNIGIQLIGNDKNKLNVPNPKIVMDDDGGVGISDASTIVTLNEELNGFNEFYQLLSPPYIVIHPISRSHTILDEIRPKFIIVYDPDVGITRQIECYKAENPGAPVRLYLMNYADSSEERSYITQLNREKIAFEKLIREKTNLIIDTEQEGKIEFDNSKLELLDTKSTSTIARNSRLGGIQRASLLSNGNGQKTIIIDSHEFKSSLPVVLHNQGYEIIPLRLEMGDFVLSPTHCIERKSISDLIGSFSSGRLYNQIEAMNRFYRNPILLIEFDQNQPFYLVPTEELNQVYVSAYALSSKLVMLTKTFPNLRIIWSRNYYSTAMIYDQLKLGQPEPDPSTVNVLPETNDDNYNFNAQDVLSSIPGVTESNIKCIMDNIDDLYHLSNLDFSQLLDILSKVDHEPAISAKNANLIFDFFNNNNF